MLRYCTVLEHILLETNIEIENLTLNAKKLTKRFEGGVNGKKTIAL